MSWIGCDNCHNLGIECMVHPQYNSCFNCRSRKIKCGLLPESKKRRPNVHPQRIREYEEEFRTQEGSSRALLRASTSRRRTPEPETSSRAVLAGCRTRLDEVHSMSLALQWRVENLEVDERILHPLLTLLAPTVCYNDNCPSVHKSMTRDWGVQGINQLSMKSNKTLGEVQNIYY
jgi:hypothetical protein